MSAGRMFIGCAAAAGAIAVVVVIGGVIAYRHLTAPVPLPASTRLVDAGSVGHAVLRLEPDNPWIRRMFSDLSQYATREPRTSDLFPVELVWSARRTGTGSEGHILSMSFSPRGRLFGLMTDVMLWRAGRSDDGKVSRVVYGGEGITAFPGTRIPGHVFVRDNSIVWSSDLDTAREAVDLVVRREKARAAPAADLPALLGLLPAAGPHTLVGAISAEGGAPARCLALLPGTELDLPEGELGRADLSFVFDAVSADIAEGEMTLDFPADTPTPEIQSAAADLARRIASLRWGQVALEASPRIEPPRAVISVKASGLATVYGLLLKEVVSVQRTLEGRRPVRQEDEGPRQDPNQSSSTFQ